MPGWTVPLMFFGFAAAVQAFSWWEVHTGRPVPSRMLDKIAAVVTMWGMLALGRLLPDPWSRRYFIAALVALTAWVWFKMATWPRNKRRAGADLPVSGAD